MTQWPVIWDRSRPFISKNIIWNLPWIRFWSNTTKVGYETTVTITPMVIYSGQSMVHGPWPLTIHQRRCCSDSEFEGCSSEDDNALRDRVFKNFTNKACNFENRFHYAAQKHNCIPWFLPKGRYLGDEDIEFCTKEETILFKESMADFRLNSTSPRYSTESLETSSNHKILSSFFSCYDNCEEFIYNYIVTSNPLKSSEWCTDYDTAFPGDIDIKISHKLLISKEYSQISEISNKV